MSCKAPQVWSKASNTDAIPTSRLSRSMLSTAMSRVKSVDAGSYGFVHQSRGSPRVGESLPTNIRTRDNSSLVPSAVDPLDVMSPPRDPVWRQKGLAVWTPTSLPQP